MNWIEKIRKRTDDKPRMRAKERESERAREWSTEKCTDLNQMQYWWWMKIQPKQNQLVSHTQSQIIMIAVCQWCDKKFAGFRNFEANGNACEMKNEWLSECNSINIWLNFRVCLYFFLSSACGGSVLTPHSSFYLSHRICHTACDTRTISKISMF